MSTLSCLILSIYCFLVCPSLLSFQLGSQSGFAVVATWPLASKLPWPHKWGGITRSIIQGSILVGVILSSHALSEPKSTALDRLDHSVSTCPGTPPLALHSVPHLPRRQEPKDQPRTATESRALGELNESEVTDPGGKARQN